MNIIQSLILGIVQGLTEFLPVSSSGHLAILKAFFGLSDIGNTFDVLLHVGTLIAIFAVYYRDIIELVVSAVYMIGAIFSNLFTFFKRLGKDEYVKQELRYKRILDTPHKRFVLLIIISTIPTGIVGVLLDDYIDAVSGGLLIPGICLLITGVVLLIADRMPEGRKTIKSTKYSDALLVGVAQAVAVFPGISRSGATISAALCCGFKKSYAVKYSFILSIPAVLGAALIKVVRLVKEPSEAVGSQMPGYIIGMLAAAIVGFFALKLLITLVKRQKYVYFSFYCFLIGLISIIGFFIVR